MAVGEVHGKSNSEGTTYSQSVGEWSEDADLIASWGNRTSFKLNLYRH